MREKFIQNLVRTTSFITVMQIAKLFKISMVIGSYTAFFSLNNCLLPLSGAFWGFGGASLVFLAKTMLGLIMNSSVFPIAQTAFYIPGLFASYYWASSSMVIRVMVPIACIIFFVVHPVGGQVWLYAMYWWIPVILYFLKKNNLFATALGSTFVAHAVGTIIWLYTVPMAPSAWFALIPIVALERLLFACGMVVLYKMYHTIVHLVGMVRTMAHGRTA